MASRRLDVGQGAIAWLFAASLLLGNACSNDTDVDFDPTPDSNGGKASNGGSIPTGGGTKNGGGSGASASGGSNANTDGGTGQGGAQGGNATTAGSNSGGNDSGAGGTAGSSSAGHGNGGTGVAGAGGMAGSSSGAGGKAGSGGMAGNAGTASNGGAAGSAGNAGTAGMSGSGGNGGDCKAASFGGHEYYFCGLVDSATAAYTKCQSLGMGMVSVESQLENAFVLKQGGASWLGGTDEVKEGEWRWVSSGALFWNGGPKGPPLPDGEVQGVYNNFLTGQPNDNGAEGVHENCISNTASGWNDIACALPGFKAACESAGPVVQPNL